MPADAEALCGKLRRDCNRELEPGLWYVAAKWRLAAGVRTLMHDAEVRD